MGDIRKQNNTSIEIEEVDNIEKKKYNEEQKQALLQKIQETR